MAQSSYRFNVNMDYDYWQHEQMAEECEELEEEEQEVKAFLNPKFKIQRMPMVRDMPASSASTPSYNIRDARNGDAICAVCGDGTAKLHYGVLACYGCKGFFRRTLTGKYRYVCRFGNNCIVDKYQRNSCRYCRFNRCLEVGMDPKAVRPDRDLTGKQKVPRVRKNKIDEELLNHMMRIQGDDWTRKLPVEVRILLMRLMSIESKVAKGDQNGPQPTEPEPVQLTMREGKISLREMFESKPQEERRTEMRYDPFRLARVDELPEIAHRRAVAAVDWVDGLTELAEVSETEDKINMVKQCYSPLTIFNFSARTAQNTKDPDILCLCSHSYVPRNLPPQFNETTQLSNNLIDRTLNELVAPLRKLNLKEEEIVPLKAIIILNPTAKGLSDHARQQIGELRDKVQDLLFHIVKELHPIYNASSRFGNLLLLLPTISTLSSVMCENMQFCQAFGGRAAGDPLLAEMFGDFKLEAESLQAGSSVSPPLLENPAEISLESISPPLIDSPTGMGGPMRSRFSVRRVDACTQTETGPPMISGFSPPSTGMSPGWGIDAGFDGTGADQYLSQLNDFDCHDLLAMME